MAAISLRQIVKRFQHARQEHTALHGISAEIADGEFVVIVGPSGCGKSTLLRLVAGLEAVSSGEIVFTRAGAGGASSRVVNALEPAERDIAMVFQNYALYPHMSVHDNMAYGLKNAGLPRDEIRARVERAAATLELQALLQRKPRQLSGGQRQRVAMGRAIVRQPQLFLFDEPLSNLDARLRAQTRLEIRKLHRELGITSLFVTHDQVEAMTLGQRLIVMNEGRIEQIGTPDEVYQRPASTFVASFIGAPPMNLIPGQADAGAAGPRFSMAGGPLDLLAAPPRPGALTLGVRPEHLHLQADQGRPIGRLQVENVEMLGAERLVHGRLSGTAPAPGPAALLITLRQDARLPAPALDTVHPLYALADSLHWFDSSTGLRLTGE